MPNFKKGKSFADNFNAKSPFRSSISEFMAMGKALGSSKSSPPTAVDFTEHYKAPEKKAANEDDTAKNAHKKRAKESIKGLNEGNERRKKESKVNDYVIPTAEEEQQKKQSGNEIKLDASNNFMSAISAFPMKYGRKK